MVLRLGRPKLGSNVIRMSVKEGEYEMAQKILQVVFKYRGSLADYEVSVAPLAEPAAQTQGLRWKVWIVNELEQVAGGIHLFDDEAAMQAYLAVAGPALSALPILTDITVKHFDVLGQLTAITRGPVGEIASA